MGRTFAMVVVAAALVVAGCTTSGNGQRAPTSSTGTQPSLASTVPTSGSTGSLANIGGIMPMPPATAPFGWAVGPAESADLAGHDFVATFQEPVYGNFDAAGAIVSFGSDSVSVHYVCYIIGSADYVLKEGSLLSVDRAGLAVDASGCKPGPDYPTMDQFRFVPELFAASPVVGVDRTHADGLRRVRIQSGPTFLDLIELPASPPQGSPRMLLETSGWTLVGAGVPPPSTLGIAHGVWYAEYDGARIPHPDGSWTVPHVVVSGSLGLDLRIMLATYEQVLASVASVPKRVLRRATAEADAVVATLTLPLTSAELDLRDEVEVLVPVGSTT